MDNEIKEILIVIIALSIMLVIVITAISIPLLISEKKSIQKEIELKKIEVYGERYEYKGDE